MSTKRRTEVLVVGAGPVGLLAALKLARLGIEVRILDQSRRTGTHSYALALHAATLRRLDREGLLGVLEKESCRVVRVGLYRGAGRHGEVALASPQGTPPHALVVPQSRLEECLEEALRRDGVQVEWNHRVESFDAATGTARVARLEPVTSGYPIARTEWVVGKTFDLTAGLTIGADGSRSGMRQALGIGLTHTAPAQVFSVFEFESSSGPEDEARLVLDDVGISVLWPLAGGRRRWSFEITEASRHQSDVDGLKRLLDQRAPWFGERPGAIRWSSAVTFARCLADSFGQGNCWLAGDAAHLTGPTGVQSMNAGLEEALRLAEAVASSRGKAASTEALAAYGRDSHRHWQALLGGAGSLDTSGARDPWLAGEAPRLLSCLPATGPDLARLMGQIGVRFNPGLS